MISKYGVISFPDVASFDNDALSTVSDNILKLISCKKQMRCEIICLQRIHLEDQTLMTPYLFCPVNRNTAKQVTIFSLVIGDLCHFLITFENRLDPDQAQ